MSARAQKIFRRVKYTFSSFIGFVFHLILYFVTDWGSIFISSVAPLPRYLNMPIFKNIPVTANALNQILGCHQETEEIS